MRAFISMLLLLFILMVGSARAQPQTHHWVFGEYLHFNISDTGFSRENNSFMNVGEGCSSISDKDGKLLFYTDGITVWNAKNKVMPNGTGLKGSNTSAQAALIVMSPGDSSLYYIFTNFSPAGLYYSTVDTRLDGGMGDVVTKNVNLRDSVTEQLAACRHSNGRDVWILSHILEGNIFLAYLLTYSGIAPAVVSNTGNSHGGGINNSGYSVLKASSNASYLASTTLERGIAELHQFNNTCGKVCNSITLLDGQENFGLYGCEFSHTGNKLYFCQTAISPIKVWQYDLTLPWDSISSSVKVIDTTSNNIGSMQLAADGRIYLSGLNYIGRIDHPERDDTACHYVDTFFALDRMYLYMGLPNFNSGLFYKDTLPYTVREGCSCEEKYTKLEFPNVLTINGDGLNDALFFGKYKFEAYDLQIFNRWGQLVFSSTDANEPFRGIFQGRLLPSGTYYGILSYQLKAENTANKISQTITVLSD